METNQPMVSILVVAFNSRSCIDQCLLAIALGCRDHPYEILLIDNGEDGTAQWVAQHHPHVRILPSRGNIGFAAANNLLAQACEAPFLLLLNPDVFVEEGAIDALIAFTDRIDDAVAWGGVTVDANGMPDTGNAIPLPSLAEFASTAFGRSRAGRSKPDLNQETAVPVLSGGFVMFKREAWNEVSGFDDTFFLYCEEVDLFHRLAQRGYSFWRVPEARAHHAIAHGDSLSPRRSLYRSAGTMHFVRKHWPRHRQIVAGFLIWMTAFTRFVAGNLFGRTSERFAKLARGYELVALRPGYWWFGYDPHRGLKRRLEQGNV